MSLGSWANHMIPGITTTTEIADDVHQQGLNILLQHQPINAEKMPLAFINAKGFGGNNASGFFVSPQQTHKLLAHKYGNQRWKDYLSRNEFIQQQAQDYDQNMTAGKIKPRYCFGENVLEPQDLQISDREIRIKGWEQAVAL